MRKWFVKQNKLQTALNIWYIVWKTTFKTIYQLSCFVGPRTLYSFLRLVYTVLHVAFSCSVYSTSGIGLPLKYKHLKRHIQGGGYLGSATFLSGSVKLFFQFFFKSPWVLSPPIENWSRGIMNEDGFYSAVYWIWLIAGPKK